MENSELRGCSNRTWLRKTAKHEAGHTLLLWLLDRYVTGVLVHENGGLTRSGTIGEEEMLPSCLLLHALAGMVMSCDKEVLFDLRDHVDNKEYFHMDSDSRFAAEIVCCFDALPTLVFAHHVQVLTRFRTRFRKPYNELVALLLQGKHLVDFKQAYELFGRWDLEFGFDKCPKSDFVMRALARELKWKVPKCGWIGWDLNPLASWEYKRPTLIEVAMKIKEQMDTLCGKHSGGP